MMYYKVNFDLQRAGVFPQSQEFKTDQKIPEGMVNLSDFCVQRDKQPFVRPIILMKKANLTDYLTCGFFTHSLGVHLISSKMMGIMEKYELPSYSTWDVPVVKRAKEIAKYKILRFDNIQPFSNFVYPKTQFRHIIENFETGTVEKFKLNNFDSISKAEQYFDNLNLDRQSRKYHSFEIEKIFLPEKFEFSWFRVRKGRMSQYQIISESLKNELQKNDITGLNFEEIKWIVRT